MKAIERVISWAVVVLAGACLGMAFPAAANDKIDTTWQPAVQGQKQGQGQEQDQAQSQDAAASSSSQSSALANSSSNGGAASSDNLISYRDRLQAPSVIAPAVYASGPCNSGWSAGASGPGAGLSFGRAKPDSSCDRRELARVLTPLNPQLALKVLCADPIAKQVATEEDCRYSAPPDTSKPAVVILEDNHSGLATSEQLKRAFEASQSK